MLSSRAACSRCTAQLRHAHHLRPSASFSAAFATLPEAASPQHALNVSSSQAHGNQRRRPQHQNQQQGARRQKQPRRPRESAFDVFNDIVDTSREPQAPASKDTHQPPTLLNELELEAKVRQLIAEEASLQTKFGRFHTMIWPHLQSLSRVPPQLRKLTADFLVSACDEMVRTGQVENSVAISRVASHIGKATPEMLGSLVLNLCHALTARPDDAAFHGNAVKEINEIWILLTQTTRRYAGKELRYYFPPTEETSKGGESLEESLASIFPQYTTEQARGLIPSLLATVCVVSDGQFSGNKKQESAAPLLNAVSKKIGPVSELKAVQFRNAEQLPKEKQDELLAYILEQWPSAAEMLADPKAEWRKGLSYGHRSATRAFHQTIRSAYRARNVPAIEAAWKKFTDKMRQSPALRLQVQNDPDFILDYCVFVFCAIRRPVQLQETIDIMTDLEIEPTLRTYTSMLHGWKICKDAHRVEALWKQLVASGMKLDIFTWTARISALITMGQPEAGVQALAEMQQIWADAKNTGTIETTGAAVEPTIEVVNAAYQGVIRLDPRAAESILGWAQRQGLKPNTRTYNILLRETFRNDAQRVHEVMKNMKDDGVEPDSATFTIILEEVLGSTTHAGPAEQVESVNQALADLEGAGMRPNLETYAKMLYAVSSLAGGSDEAIDAILQHMRGSNLTMTPHMITILIERAVAQQRPDITSVTDLLAKHGMTDVSKGDQTLWERVMSAHAVTGDPTSAMGIFNNLASKGRPVTSLSCLRDLLRSLHDAGMMETAQGVVDVVINHKLESGKASGSRDDRYWRHQFWHLARNWGLLKDNTPPELMEQLGRS